MTHRTSILLALVGSSAVAFGLDACGGDNGNGDAGGDATSQDVVGNDVQQQDTGPTKDAGDAGTDANPVPCKGSDAGCAKCCAALDRDAATIFVTDEATCACANPGDCNTQPTCKQNLCNGNPPTPACDLCLNDKDAGDCFANTVSTCLGDPNCAPLIACVIACGGVQDAGGGG